MFTVAGSIAAQGLATWDPASGAFAALPTPPGFLLGWTEVRALAVLPNGALAVSYHDWSGTSGRVAAWNGAAWTQLGANFDEAPLVLHVRPNGELFAGGQFTNYGGGTILRLARWNGTAWQAVGGGLDDSVSALADDANGDLLVGGSFSTAGVVAAGGTARWNGVAWSALGGSLRATAIAVSSGRIFAASLVGFHELVGGNWTLVPGLGAGPFPQAQLLTAVRLANGSIFVGGVLSSAGGVATNQVARFDPATNTWAALGTGLDQPTRGGRPAVVELAGGDLLVGGAFAIAGGVPVAHLARWNGSQWSALANGPATLLDCAVVIDNARFAVGGRFTGLGNLVASNVAEWNGSAWVPMGTGLGGPVLDLARLPNGDLVAVGSFTTTGSGGGARGIARWDGNTWSELGGGLQNFTGSGIGGELLVRANGDLVVVGSFTGAGGAAFPNIAVWNGVAWTGLAAGLPIPFGAANVVEAANGDLLVADAQTVHRWNRTSWSIAWTMQAGDRIADIAPLNDGGFVVAGRRELFFGTDTRGVLEYVHVGGWTMRRETLEPRSYLTELVRLPGGDILVTGQFSSLAVPSGSVVATANQGCVRMAPNGTFVPFPAARLVSDADAFPNGDRLLVGAPVGLDVPASSVHFVGRLMTTCPATASAGGVGCSGSGGTNVLAPRALPWLGDVCESLATGMPAQGLALGVLGLGTAAVPLTAVLPQALPNCTLLVTPDLLDVYLPNAGSVVAAFSIPRVAALVGALLHQQVVAIETGAGGAFTGVTATNRLSLTIGSF